jgi:hypothetical protein
MKRRAWRSSVPNRASGEVGVFLRKRRGVDQQKDDVIAAPAGWERLALVEHDVVRRAMPRLVDGVVNTGALDLLSGLEKSGERGATFFELHGFTSGLWNLCFGYLLVNSTILPGMQARVAAQSGFWEISCLVAPQPGSQPANAGGRV